MKIQVLATVNDLVDKFLKDDRKEDEDLPAGEIERLIINKEITIQEIIQEFEHRLYYGVMNYKWQK